MAAGKVQIHWEELRRFRQPGLLFGGGVLAGVLVFLLWLAWRPDAPIAKSATQPAASGAAAGAGVAGADGVLGGITGGPEAGASPSLQSPLGDEIHAQVEQAPAADEPGSADAQFSVEGDFDQSAQEGGAMADEAMLPPDEGAAELQTWYIEVWRGPQQSEILEVNARSVQHALEILRDFRGDPHVLRGPSLRPLD